MNVDELLNRRNDLSTFLVHLTRKSETASAKENLKSILKGQKIVASSVFGHLQKYEKQLEASGRLKTQQCVCFTETPLEYCYILVSEIEDRQFEFEPYGVAITKRIGRERGLNPIWYLDQSPGHGWLTTNLDNLRKGYFDNGCTDRDLEKIFPFIEHMGNGTNNFGRGYRKEFWWEREWRHIGNFKLPDTLICLCPENEISEFKKFMKEREIEGSCVDPRWSLEKIIAHLAGFSKNEINILRG